LRATGKAPLSNGLRKNKNPQPDAPRRRLPHDPATSGPGRNQDEIGCHTFGATGITAYLKNGWRVEGAADVRASIIQNDRAPPRRGVEVSLDEVEKIAI